MGCYHSVTLGAFYRKRICNHQVGGSNPFTGSNVFSQMRASNLPAAIVAAKILMPVISGVVNEDGDRAFHHDFAVHLAAEAICAAGWRADGQNDAFIGDLRNGGKTPIGARTHDEARARLELIEGYLSFGSFHDFRELL